MKIKTTFVTGALEGARLISQHGSMVSAKKALSKARRKDPRAEVYTLAAWQKAMDSEADPKERRVEADASTDAVVAQELEKKAKKKSTTKKKAQPAVKAPKGAIRVKKEGNPFREGTTNAARYNLVKDKMAVADFYAAHAKAEFPGSVAGLLRVAEERGFIRVV
jgi:hypothetical protein